MRVSNNFTKHRNYVEAFQTRTEISLKNSKKKSAKNELSEI